MAFRARELFYDLKGGTVDYGEEHGIITDGYFFLFLGIFKLTN